MRHIHEVFEKFLVCDEKAKSAYSKNIFEKAERALKRHEIYYIEDLEGVSLKSLTESVGGYCGLGPKGMAITYIIAEHYGINLINDIPEDNEAFQHSVKRLRQVSYIKD